MNELTRKYISGALEMVNAPDGYEWGKETPKGADCSGVVAWALNRAGFQYRITAHEFYYSLFKTENRNLYADMFPAYPSVIVGIDPKNTVWSHECKANQPHVTHIAPLIGNGLCVNANYQGDDIEVISIYEFVKKYTGYGLEVRTAHTNESILERNNGEWVYGLDIDWREID